MDNRIFGDPSKDNAIAKTQIDSYEEELCKDLEEKIKLRGDNIENAHERAKEILNATKINLQLFDEKFTFKEEFAMAEKGKIIKDNAGHPIVSSQNIKSWRSAFGNLMNLICIEELKQIGKKEFENLDISKMGTAMLFVQLTFMHNLNLLEKNDAIERYIPKLFSAYFGINTGRLNLPYGVAVINPKENVQVYFDESVSVEDRIKFFSDHITCLCTILMNTLALVEQGFISLLPTAQAEEALRSHPQAKNAILRIGSEPDGLVLSVIFDIGRDGKLNIGHYKTSPGYRTVVNLDGFIFQYGNLQECLNFVKNTTTCSLILKTDEKGGYVPVDKTELNKLTGKEANEAVKDKYTSSYEGAKYVWASTHPDQEPGSKQRQKHKIHK